MNKLKLLSISLLFILLPSIVYADCTKEEIDYFKKIEDEYKVTYEYNRDSQDYNVTFYAPEPDKYDFYAHIGENITCRVVDEDTSICYNIPFGTYLIEIIGTTNSCTDTQKSISISLEKNNNYSDDPLCEGIEEFVLCQPTYDKEIDYDTFVSRVNTYKKTKQRKMTEEEKDNPKNNETINNILNFFKENIFQIIIIIIFAIAITITIILTAKSIRKSRRLE